MRQLSFFVIFFSSATKSACSRGKFFTMAAAIELRTKVLHGYRMLLRVRKIPFHGDARALTESARELRRQFEHNRAETDALKIQEMLRGVKQARDMLIYHIAQGKRNDAGNFEVKIRPEQAGAMETDSEIIHIDEQNIPAQPKPMVETVTSRKQ